MAFNNYTSITKLKSSTVKWNIKVRAQAVWKGITRETKEFRGLNLILVDDSKFRIHAFINARFAYLFEKRLEEGQIYDISNFIVQDYTGMEFHRCVRFEKHIFFADYTKLERSSDDGLKIPNCAFDFFNLIDLEKMEANKRFLCDVYGIVKSDTNLRDYVNDNQESKKQKKFSITDGSCTIKVTFFDEFAEHAEQLLKNASSGPTCIVIASAKIGRFQGELTLSNYPATRIYLNFDHSGVNELRTRALDPKFHNNVVVKEEHTARVMTVSEIKNLTEEEFEIKAVCHLTVKKVEEKLDWYDTICTNCNTLLKEESGRFQCKKCGRYYPWPQKRFRVCVLCSDSTGVIPIILGDREVRKLTGKTVFDITLDQAADDEDKFPEIIKDFHNRQYKITLKVSSENVKKESEIYEASEIEVEGNEKLTNSPGQDLCGTNISVEMASLSAEDHANQMESDTANTETHIHSIDMEADETQTPQQQKPATKSRVRKSPEFGTNIPDNLSVTQKKAVKLKKEKVAVQLSKKKTTPPQRKSLTKQPAKTTSEPEQHTEDDNISLTNYQKKIRKQGKKPIV